MCTLRAVCDCADDVVAMSGAYTDDQDMARRCQVECERELMLNGLKTFLELAALLVALMPSVPVHICDPRPTTARRGATRAGIGDGRRSHQHPQAEHAC